MFLKIGSKPNAGGVHIRRTMMLKALTQVLDATGAAMISYKEYKNLVVNANILGLSTQSNRQITWSCLTTLYGFDDTPLFRNFHRLWQRSSEAHRVSLAVVLGLSRDKVFSNSGEWVTALPVGSPVNSAFFLDGIHSAYPAHYSEKSAASMSRNLVSSWKQSGWIDGTTWTRKTALVGPGALALAIFIAWAEGFRGEQLYQAPIAKLLLRDIPEPRALLWEAHRNGFLNFYDAGGISDIRFPGWLTKEEEDALHGSI